jgi:hypothetical protein
MNHKIWKYLVLIGIVLFFSCKGQNKTNTIESSTNKANAEETIANLPLIIKIYNQSVSPEWTIKHVEKWNQWIVNDDNLPEEYTSYEDYLSVSRFIVETNMSNNSLNIKDNGTGGGGGSISFSELSNKADKYVYLLINKSTSPEWIEADVSLAFYDKKLQNLAVKKELSNPVVNFDLFFLPEQDLSILKEYEVLSIDYVYDYSKKILTASLFESYMYNCKSEHAFAGVDDNTKTLICNLLEQIDVREIPFKWNEAEQRFTIKGGSLDDLLVGIWHDQPVVSSALGATLTFYPDNTYRDRIGEGSTEKNVYTKGKWKIEDGMLEYTPQKIGAKEGEKIIEKESDIKSFKHKISDITFNEDFNKQTVTIGKQTYYKLDENPNEDYWSE